MRPPAPALPIDPVLPDLAAALAAGTNAVLQAPPGAGKTTRVPLALLDAPWLGSGRIVMLEPRRLAARAAAARMAATLGEAVGDTVGYRIRLDTRVGPKTRIEVVTEGILTRMLQSDPELTGVGCLIFDEFHERSLNADLGLALALEAQGALRDDLRILVMSATLDAAPVAALMGGCPLITSEGRAFPVETRYAPPPKPDTRLEDHVAAVVRQALAEEAGSALVFLPGQGEIRRVEQRLAGSLPAGVAVHALFGDLPQAKQDAAIAPAPPGTRKVVLATTIAETSLTIDGIRIVVDGGLARVPRFEPRSGMSRLETVKVSQAAAEQRRGRAGRLEPGVCWRCWAEAGHKALPAFGRPEILDADLAPLALDLAQWGAADPAALPWLDAPPPAHYAQARDLLVRLGALDGDGRITPHGQALAPLPLHPRLAHMVVTGEALGHGPLACLLAALLSERDVLRAGRSDCDLRSRVAVLLRDDDAPAGADPGAVRRVREAARQVARAAGIKGQARDAAATGLLLALAYPDRVGQRRGGQVRLANGRGAALPDGDGLAAADWLAVADVDAGKAAQARIWLAAPLSPAEIEEAFGPEIVAGTFVVWDPREEAVAARRQRRFGALVLKDEPLSALPADRTAEAVCEGIRQIGLHALPWSPETDAYRDRLRFLHRVEGPDEGWPDVSDEALLATLDTWLAPFLAGVTRRAHFKRIDLKAALESLLPWEMRRRLEAEAPTHLQVPTGNRHRLDYSGEDPVLPVKLQEMFGARETPRVAGGRVAVVIHLLSPAQRPLAVTRDLPFFWREAYPSVKAEMRGRYPKHPWPDDPLAAAPTARTKPRGG
ncbi:ATP-dependent helicase HrpB [Caenispirillum bisanense]|uniref:ATP-dependent helicase HrpB n=1 Tax=Caenispirillum bisanense TaxID=414052 RepID=A0A286GH62_9PROT|nr:ATP-dependent helicase HrpB [Caenispirillum bisanense]SOD94873.1 ATP-dependent helicase HrpB [Caenispirillum bisanense]